MSIGLIALAFVSIFVVELPDKTFIATLVLSTKYRPLFVWIGVGSAFAVQTVIAVAVGGVAGLLPKDLIHGVAGLIFLAGAVLLLREGIKALREHDAVERGNDDAIAAKAKPRKGWHQIVASFAILFLAEWGDLSQLLTISMVAKYDHVISIFIGSLSALLVVSAMAAVAGQQLLKYVKVHVLQFIGSALCFVMAIVTAVELFA